MTALSPSANGRGASNRHGKPRAITSLAPPQNGRRAENSRERIVAGRRFIVLHKNFFDSQHRAVAITYIRDIAPELDDGRDLVDTICDLRVLDEVVRLTQLGAVMAGMCSCLEFVAMMDVKDEIDRMAGRGRHAPAMPTLEEALAAIPPQRHKDMLIDRHNVLMEYAEMTDADGARLHPDAAEYRDAQEAWWDEELEYAAHP